MGIFKYGKTKQTKKKIIKKILNFKKKKKKSVSRSPMDALNNENLKDYYLPGKRNRWPQGGGH